ncbi:hypothetical protein NIASO_14695 [Niabella soli DSM 19437]|uniref:Uncharacterized protein n=1 Tax=Niabella soli DSM 19437 TaxID=929713 RepID=W0F490_9BACT|nr:hypothetical protein NIASO_14695 [Niabella soli DSM 19437]
MADGGRFVKFFSDSVLLWQKMQWLLIDPGSLSMHCPHKKAAFYGMHSTKRTFLNFDRTGSG